MMVMTAKVDMKKILLLLAGAAALILSLILLLGGKDDAAETSAPVSSNDERVQFLRNFGWDVTTSPTESSQVRIPKEESQTMTITVTVPQREPEPTFWDDVVWFFQGLFKDS